MRTTRTTHRHHASGPHKAPGFRSVAPNAPVVPLSNVKGFSMRRAIAGSRPMIDGIRKRANAGRQPSLHASCHLPFRDMDVAVVR